MAPSWHNHTYGGTSPVVNATSSPPAAYLDHNPHTGVRIGEAPHPGPPAQACFDEFDAALADEGDYLAGLAPPSEHEEPPDLVSET